MSGDAVDTAIAAIGLIRRVVLWQPNFLAVGMFSLDSEAQVLLQGFRQPIGIEHNSKAIDILGSIRVSPSYSKKGNGYKQELAARSTRQSNSWRR